MHVEGCGCIVEGSVCVEGCLLSTGLQICPSGLSTSMCVCYTEPSCKQGAIWPDNGALIGCGCDNKESLTSRSGVELVNSITSPTSTATLMNRAFLCLGWHGNQVLIARSVDIPTHQWIPATPDARSYFLHLPLKMQWNLTFS